MTKNNNNQPTNNNEGVVNMKKSEEVQEAVNTVKSMSIKESNENDVKIAEVIMDGMEKQKEIDHRTRIAELEVKKLMEENMRISKEHQAQLDHKYKVINRVSEAAVTLGALATITTITCVTMTTGRELRLEELRLGMDE
ncbi:hypothetical protein [Priestia megaterium]|uniref:hypothetical protein n=1 Tax=Priestia megaterium TaxID=1404 RepID=UPI002E231B56|nr:hypothetical protein [Priestia megaterium]